MPHLPEHDPSGDDEKVNAIRHEAQAAGFDSVAITTADVDPILEERLKIFLQANYQGTMEWMTTRIEERANPKNLWPDARSIIILGMNYGPKHNPLPRLTHKTMGNISVYAQNNDYHDVIKKRLKQIARWLVASYGGEVKVFVDTAPVMEKPLAQKAGLGWQGKHTNLVSRTHGSWLFLGCIFTSLALPADAPEQDHCGSCTNCLDICPTKAFPAPYQLDARRCISYLTIEHKGSIPEAFRKPMGNRIYGCDDCLAVCPWNKFAAAAQETAFHARDSLKEPSLAHLLCLEDAQFRQLFSKSPVKRIGRNRFIRNVLIAAGNSEDISLLEVVAPYLNDEDPVLRETAGWAYAQLRV